MLQEILNSPMTQLAIAAVIGYLLRDWITDKDGDGNKEVAGFEIDRDVAQDLLGKLQQAGLGSVAGIISAILVGKPVDAQAQAKTLANQLGTAAGKYAALGDTVRKYLDEMAVMDSEEFASIVAHVNNRKKDIADNAARVLELNK